MDFFVCVVIVAVAVPRHNYYLRDFDYRLQARISLIKLRVKHFKKLFSFFFALLLSTPRRAMHLLELDAHYDGCKAKRKRTRILMFRIECKINWNFNEFDSSDSWSKFSCFEHNRIVSHSVFITHTHRFLRSIDFPQVPSKLYDFYDSD